MRLTYKIRVFILIIMLMNLAWADDFDNKDLTPEINKPLHLHKPLINLYL